MALRRPTTPARALLPLLLCASIAPAQTPEQGGSDDPPEQPTSTLLVRLKSRRVDLDTARALTDELSTRKTRDRLQAHRALRDHYERRLKAYDKLAARALGRLEEAAAKAQKDLLGRRGEAEVEQLRGEALAVTRGDGLTKRAIKAEIDPRVERLEALLLPKITDVLSADPRVDAELGELRAAHRELQDWHAVCAGVVAGLELHEDATRHFARYPTPASPGGPERVEQRLAFARFAGLPMSSGDRKALEHNEELRAATPHEEYLGTLALNRTRYLLGLGLVRNDPKLSDAARDHSKDMHTLGFFSHTSPVEGKERFGQRAANFGTSASAENIAAGQQSGAGAIRAWWYSPGHHKNMLGNHRRTGLGQHAAMWTQMFGG